MRREQILRVLRRRYKGVAVFEWLLMAGLTLLCADILYSIYQTGLHSGDYFLR